MWRFLVIFKGAHFIQQGIQIDDGVAAAEYAKKKGYDIRIWSMYGLTHFWELPDETKKEIKSFIKSLH